MPQQLNPNERMEDRLLTVTEVAKRLRVDETTVRRYIIGGNLEAVTLPHRGKRKMYRVKQSVLDRLLQPRRVIP